MTSSGARPDRQIGPIGTAARVLAAAALLAYGFASGPSVLEILAGFVLLPIAEMVIVFALRPRGSGSLHLYGTAGYAVNFGTAGLLLALWPIPAMLFYGASIIPAAIRGYAGCEILALSNLLRRRDDQLACAVFSPIDAMEGVSAGHG